VLSENWRRGVGTALHDVCIEHLRRSGFAEVVLWAFGANPGAKAFYERLGWQPDGAQVERDFAGAALAIVRYRRPL
jgi:GNAT superfamily N-acetyltransferase